MADRVKTTQVLAQVETRPPPIVRVYQMCVQVEYIPGVLYAYEGAGGAVAGGSAGTSKGKDAGSGVGGAILGGEADVAAGTATAFVAEGGFIAGGEAVSNIMHVHPPPEARMGFIMGGGAVFFYYRAVAGGECHLSPYEPEGDWEPYISQEEDLPPFTSSDPRRGQ